MKKKEEEDAKAQEQQKIKEAKKIQSKAVMLDALTDKMKKDVSKELKNFFKNKIKAQSNEDLSKTESDITNIRPSTS